jgi:hypothetical protein
MPMHLFRGSTTPEVCKLPFSYLVPAETQKLASDRPGTVHSFEPGFIRTPRAIRMKTSPPHPFTATTCT